MMAWIHDLPIVAITLLTLFVNFFPAYWIRNREKVAIDVVDDSRTDIRFVKANYNRILVIFFVLCFVGIFVSSPHSPRTIGILALLSAGLAILNGYLGVQMNLYSVETRFPFNSFVLDKDHNFRWLAGTQILIAILAILAVIVDFWAYG